MIVNGNIPVSHRRANASSKSLRDSDRSTFSITVEFLNTCSFHCPGCFVKRKNNYTTEDLDAINNLAQQVSDNGFEADEIFLGPTDLFGCDNAETILQEPKFISIFDHFQALTFTSTLQSDPTHTQNIMDIIKDNFPSHVYVEIIIAFDLNAFCDNNREYIELFERNLAIVSSTNIILAFNIHDKGLFDRYSYSDVSEELNNKYNSHLKMIPSFFRSQKTSLILDNIATWNTKMEELIDNTTSNVLNNMSDVHFGGFTYYVYTYKDGILYANPYIYDFIMEKNESLVIPNNNGMYDILDIFKFENNIVRDQYQYATKTTECNNCSYLSSCVGKKVLTFMQNRDIVDCFLPKRLMDFNN